MNTLTTTPRPELNVTVNIGRDSFMTNYEVTGPKGDCEAWLERLKSDFHPMGYGTRGEFVNVLEDGTHVLNASRYNSCD